MATDNPLTPDQRRTIETEIERELIRASARVAALKRNFEDMVRSSEGSPPDDEHDPDGATSGFERAQIAALLKATEEEVGQLEDARARLADGAYGSCRTCGRSIAFERLLSRPASPVCVVCAAAR